MIWINVFGAIEKDVLHIATPTFLIEAPESVPDFEVADKTDFVAAILNLLGHITIFEKLFRLVEVAIYGFQHTATVSAVAAVEHIFLCHQAPNAFGLINLVTDPGDPIDDR